MAPEVVTGITYRKDFPLPAWWPDYDHAPLKCIEFVRNGLPAIDVVMRYVKKARTAVQAGGHAGFWPRRLARDFRSVHTFEPEPLLFECMKRNCQEPNVTMHRQGLGAVVGSAPFKSHVSAGSWKVDPAGEHQISLTTVDALELVHCDALLLDIEGYEVAALEGASATIQRCRPVILCELLPRSAESIHAWLVERGYTQRERFGRDGIYVHTSQLVRLR